MFKVKQKSHELFKQEKQKNITYLSWKYQSNDEIIPTKISPEDLIIQQQHSAATSPAKFVVSIKQLQMFSQEQISQHNSLTHPEQHWKHYSVHPYGEHKYWQQLPTSRQHYSQQQYPSSLDRQFVGKLQQFLKNCPN